MQHSTVIWLILLLCPFLAVPGMAAQNPEDSSSERVLELEEAIQIGLEKNPRVQAAEMAIKRSQSEVKSVRGQFLPRATASYSRTYLDSIRASGPTDQDYLDQTQDTWTVSVVQTLFAGKTILNSYQRTQIEKEASQVEKESQERKLIRDIQEEFLKLLKVREDKRSLKKRIERLQVGKEAAQAFYQKELAPVVEVLQAEVELDQTRQELTQVENEEAIHQDRLNRLLGFEDQRDIKYQGSLEDIPLKREFDLQNCLRTALEQRPELELVTKNIRIAGKEKDIALGKLLPRVELEASYTDRARDYDEKGSSTNPMSGEEETYDRDQDNQYWTTGINVQWNFFSGGQQYYQSQSMDYEMQRLKKIYQDTASEISTEARSAFRSLQEARQRVESTRRTQETAKENYRMQEQRFKRRITPIQELLNAQDRLTRAEANHNQALLDFQLALAELYFAMGERNLDLR